MMRQPPGAPVSILSRVRDLITGPRADAIVMNDIPDGGATTAYTSTPAPIKWLAREYRQAVASTGIGRRVVHALPGAAVAKGWSVVRDEERDVTKDLDARLNLRTVLRDADALARQDGLSWMLPIVRGTLDLSKPRPATIDPETIAVVHAVTTYEAVPITWDSDPASPYLGQPRTLMVTLMRESASVVLGTVHRSWLIRVGGLTLDPTQTSPPDRAGADMSAVEAYWPYLADLDLTGASMAQTARMISIPWIQLANGAPAAAGERSTQRRDMLSRLRRAMGIFGLVPLSSGDSMGVLSPSLAGIRDLSSIQYERLSSVEGAPVEWITGMRVGGLGADASGQAEQIRAFVGSHQDEVLTPAMLEFYDLALGRDPSRVIEWPPVDEPTELTAAQVELTRAQAAGARVVAGITLPSDERLYLSGLGPSDLPEPEAVDVGGEMSDDEVAELAARVAPVVA